MAAYIINTVGLFIIATMAFYTVFSNLVFRTQEAFWEYLTILGLSFIQFGWLGVLCEWKFNRFLRQLSVDQHLREHQLSQVVPKPVLEVKPETRESIGH